ncbi:uncharacterized protein LOC131942114 [Physella acuta]|uniref:uncharacterized protein LOC131942114 n=1 Tax=Physella acuta TaxID=109671 RepID=UPI0027DCE999|nr:uncharacterized protein LOC131942114 [Physella acuta]XP_059157823.1 uncharacterized protein LOC131942114 [Physella acuta]
MEDLQKEKELKKIHCSKNPGHTKFIPINDFKVKNLPEQFRTSENYDFIILLAQLTVRLSLNLVTGNRPDGYFLSQMRNKKASRTGTGQIQKVRMDPDTLKCHCRECKTQTFKNSWIISIQTAAHLIFDTTEAEDTRVDVFYDDEEKRENIKILYGLSIKNQNTENDTCILECVTHDQELGHQITELVDQFLKMEKQVSHSLSEKYDSAPLNFIISHLHESSDPKSLGFLMQNFNPLILDNSDQSSFEANLENIEVEVHFPDGENSKKKIWMFDKQVLETKDFLFHEGGLNLYQSVDWQMVIIKSCGGKIIMDDKKNTKDYLNDLVEAKYITFIKNDNLPGLIENVTLKN